MEIDHFVVTEDHEVTLTMIDMPTTGVRTENTVVYIKGAPLGRPQEVSGTNGTITFSARTAYSNGKISVKITLENGQTLTATSAEDYEILEPVWRPDEPSVMAITPREASPDSMVTLTGDHLSQVYAVALQNTGTSYLVARAQSSSERTVKFRVPRDADKMVGATVRVFIRTEAESRMRRTSVRLKISKAV